MAKEKRFKESKVKEKINNWKTSNKNKDQDKENKPELIIKKEASGNDYYDEPEIPDETEEETDDKKFRPARYILIFVASLAVIMLIFVGANSIDFSDIASWIKMGVTGSGVGDGYPVHLVGSDISPANFMAVDGDAVTLSDTALTAVSLTGKELFSERHSCFAPMLRNSKDKFIVYDCGGESYEVSDMKGNTLKYTGDVPITAGDISSSGNYALLTQPKDYASQLDIYNKKGESIYTYKFADSYATALALNGSGNMCAVASVFTSDGEASTLISILDITEKKPVAQYTMKGNCVTSIFWEGSYIYAVGDSNVAICGHSYEFTEYGYDGRQITAVSFESNRLFVSVSGYSQSGPSTLLVFSGNEAPKSIELPDRIKDISAYGSVVGVLVGTKIYSFDSVSGEALGTAEAGYDASALAMINESNAYILGAKEIRGASLVAG